MGLANAGYLEYDSSREMEMKGISTLALLTSIELCLRGGRGGTL